MVHCIAYGCQNGTNEQKKGKSFFRVPKKGVGAENVLRKKWFLKLRLANVSDSDNIRVCEDHFTNDDFDHVDDLKCSLGFAKYKKKLRPAAVPTVFVFSKKCAVRTLSRRRAEQKDRKEVLKDLIHESPPDTEAGNHDLLSLEPEVEQEDVPCSKFDVAVQVPEWTYIDHTYGKHCEYEADTRDIGTQTELLPAAPASVWDCVDTTTEQALSLPHTTVHSPRNLDADSYVCGPCIGSETLLATQASPHCQTAQSDSDVLVESDVSDTDYAPSSMESTSSDNDVSEEEDDNSTPENEDTFLGFSGNLDALFKFCSQCGLPVTEIRKFMRGTMLAVTWTCQNGCHETWYSQPSERAMPMGKLLVAAAILFSGGQFQKFADFANILRLGMISETAFYRLQGEYLFPVIEAEYSLRQTAILGAITGETVYVLGDGQCDSPGHSAKYLTYTLMEEQSDLIVASSVVSVGEPGINNSCAMEKEGLDRCLQLLEDHHVTIEGLATDRHPQITKYMRTERPNIEHQYEIFHTAKGVTKKLSKAAQKRDATDLLPWIQAISNMMWWSCATCQEDEKVLKEKWLSVQNHIVNIHSWASNEIFHKCAHPPLTRDEKRSTKWLEKGSAAHKAACDVISNPRLLTDLKKMTKFKHTGSIEVHNNSRLKFCPKRCHFSYRGMVARNMLAVLEHNENVGREQATTKKGEARYNVVFTKRRYEWVTKKIYATKTCLYREALMKRLVALRLDPTTVQVELEVPDLPINIGSQHEPKPNKKEAVAAHRTRFHRQ